MDRFLDRVDAGRRLASSVGDVGDDAVVVGLARGGVIVADEVAAALDLDLDVLVVRKVGLPGREEVAMGALAEGGEEVRDAATLRSAMVSDRAFERVRNAERRILDRRVDRYRAAVPPIDVANRAVVCVDDGVATGATALVALRALRARGARTLTLAVPVGSATALRGLERGADAVVALVEARGAFAVGQYYEEFAPTSDDEVVARLLAARRRRGGA